MKNIHLIKTSNKNHYLYNYNLERLFLIPTQFFNILSEAMFSENSEDYKYYNRKKQYFQKHNLLNKTIKQPKPVRFTGAMVQNSFINTNQITFEITDKCNIACKYCAYRELYDDYDERVGINLTEDKAIALLDKLVAFWQTSKDTSSNKVVDIGFYGGEPTLNMTFVVKIVEHVKRYKDIDRTFSFSMTTNAVLLHKYMDFLYQHQFRLLISLDGNRENNMNRLDKNGHSVFERVVSNVDLLKSKYPAYFNDYVGFNVVLHDKNPLNDIYSFFNEKYGKTPRLSPLGTSGRREDKKDVFKSMERNILKEIGEADNSEELQKWMNVSEPGYLGFVNFVYQIMGSAYANYNDLISVEKTQKDFLSGTCFPFSRKIYLTVNNKILPCERIGHKYVLGCIKDSVLIDFEKIAEFYNTLFAEVAKKCSVCYGYKSCMLCLLAENGTCNMRMSEESFNRRWKYYIEKLEKTPELYNFIKYKLAIR